MVTYYNRKDMVSFGKYLMSAERTQRVKESVKQDVKNLMDGADGRLPLTVEERLKDVSHADIENWKELQEQSKN